MSDDDSTVCIRCDVDPCRCTDLPGGRSPAHVSGERYDRMTEGFMRRSRQRAQLTQAILDIDAAAIPLGETEDGFVAVGYFVPIGPLHRALGVIGHSAAKNIDHQPPEWWMRLLRRAVEQTHAAATPRADTLEGRDG